VTPEGVTAGLASPDGNTVLATTADQKFSLYPLAGGAPRSLPQIQRDEVPVAWIGNDSVLLYRTGQLPLHIEKMYLATGKRTPVRDLSPADRSGVLGINFVTVSSDGKWYAYGYSRDTSQLFTVAGVK